MHLKMHFYMHFKMHFKMHLKKKKISNKKIIYLKLLFIFKRGLIIDFDFTKLFCLI